MKGKTFYQRPRSRVGGVISAQSPERKAEIGTVQDEFRTIYIEDLDLVVDLIDL